MSVKSHPNIDKAVFTRKAKDVDPFLNIAKTFGRFVAERLKVAKQQEIAQNGQNIQILLLKGRNILVWVKRRVGNIT